MSGGLRSLLEEASPAAPALEQDGRTWSYDRLRRSAEAWAASAIPAPPPGETPPAPVAVVLPPTAEGVIAVHAALRSGRLVAPLNPALTAPEMAVALEALTPAVVWTDEAHAAVVRAAAGRVAPATVVTVVGEAVPDDPGSGAPRVGSGRVGGSPPDSAEGGDADREPVAAIWTSGTSGRAHGVLLSAPGLRHSALAARRRLELSAEDRWYGSLSLAHVGGLALVTRAALLGATVVAADGFDADGLADLVERGEVTHASLVPTMLRRLLGARAGRPAPGTLRCLLIGGAACPPDLVSEALDLGYPIALTYGLTEATSQVATAPPGLVRRKPGTVGPPLDGVEVAIGARGNVRVRGPTVAPGVVGGPATPVDGLVDADGWLDTGDLGELDEDGHLRILGRRSDRIVTGGVNVDPAEVEAALSGHPAVRECAVVGVPDPEWGERVSALVVVAPGPGAGPGEALRSWLRERLTGAKVPREIRIVAALPRNPNGKVDRERARALFAGPFTS